MASRPWSKPEVALLFKLRNQDDLGWKEIGLQLDRNYKQCCARYYYKRGHRAEGGNKLPAVTSRSIKTVAEIDARPCNPQFIERERRLNARDQRDHAALARGDVTAIVLGDPPPGFSALDRRRARA